jgi:hypothetical protein
LVRRLPVIAASTVVFLIAFILDTGAVLRLFWACLMGEIGPGPRLVAFSVLLLVLGVMVLLLYRPEQRPLVKARKKPIPRAIRGDGKAERTNVTEPAPVDVTKPAKRRRRPASTTETQPPS